ncbi:nuclear transport factor 2 family protein [Actinoplanes sp. M2I2]|uniref:nuclear transport factor 2 family protein n=1 Tax=Actinoplanes sp. M2I2 TaxID=1734444 RepID=UPI002021A0C7|nr:nuclear transport factor 2 family protein [Actinoplanes sp. M2I2]
MSTADDRLALRELVDAYARHADRRDPHRQAEVFTEDGRVTLFDGDPALRAPIQLVQGRDNLIQAFESLMTRYAVTTYLNGQSTVAVDGESATGETYCLAHHLYERDGVRTLLIMAIRYLDTFVRTGRGWLIADRRLVIDWTDERPSAPQRQ